MTTASTPIWSEEFDAIACYQDEDVAPTLSDLINHPDFRQVLALFDDNAPPADNSNTLQSLHASLAQLRDLQSFQDWVAATMLPRIALRYNSFTSSGLDQLDSARQYLFVSNHRDIVMDPLLINVALRAHQFAPTQCAIGDNLLINPIARALARLNRCFTVVRSHTSPKAILRSMRVQSSYIAHVLHTAGQNIWIAQREGRAKDNRDLTNPALLKMFSLCRDRTQSHADYLNSLNIVPVSLSYELDPCDVIKARQLRNQEQERNYVKTAREDLEAVIKGLRGDKGRIHVHFGEVLHFEDTQDIAHMAQRIDTSIHRNYTVYPVNDAAERILNDGVTPETTFTERELDEAGETLHARLQHEPDDIRRRVLRAYATLSAAKRAATKTA